MKRCPTTQLNKFGSGYIEDVGNYSDLQATMQIAALAMFTAPSISCQTNSLSLHRGKEGLMGSVWRAREGQNTPLFYAKQPRSPFNISVVAGE
jgi:hypothetical protein